MNKVDRVSPLTDPSLFFFAVWVHTSDKMITTALPKHCWRGGVRRPTSGPCSVFSAVVAVAFCVTVIAAPDGSRSHNRAKTSPTGRQRVVSKQTDELSWFRYDSVGNLEFLKQFYI